MFVLKLYGIQTGFKWIIKSYGYRITKDIIWQAKVELSPELQVLKMRTQMAKLNHRLMALELENQSQSTRWQVYIR